MKKQHPTGNNNWYCKDCGKDCYVADKDYYMVTHEIWAKFGLGDKSGMLCMDCMEERLGHKLTKTDILLCPLTTHINPYTRGILNS